MPYLLTTTKYAKQGDLVTVISDRGTAVIVEDLAGVRFSVRSELLGEEEPPEIVVVEVKPIDLFNQI